MSTARLRRHVPNAAPEALAILDPARGAIEPPIRAEIFAAARFRQHGRSLGEAHAARSRTSRSAFFPRLHDNIAVLREAHRYIGSQERSGRYVSPAGEWLLDNFHVVVAQIKEIHDGLPRRYFRDLPVLIDAHLAGLPRIYGVAWAYVAHTDSAFDEALLVDFLSAYQETRELTLGELWALRTAMASAMRLLVDDAAGLIRMLDPPFATATPNAGYIQAYPPGVRENGGQYSHAGVWAVMAQASLGDADAAYRMFTRLSPAHRSTNPTQATAYQLEPYVMAGDIYTHAPYVGRGGWSWYTGSAAWMHRAAIESICGLRVRGGSISVTPRLPTHWPSITITLRRERRTHELIVCAPWASAEIARATARGAVELHVGESLVLADAGESSCHLVVATDAEAEQPFAVSMHTTDGQHGDVPLSA